MIWQNLTVAITGNIILCYWILGLFHSTIWQEWCQHLKDNEHAPVLSATKRDGPQAVSHGYLITYAASQAPTKEGDVIWCYLLLTLRLHLACTEMLFMAKVCM